MHPFRASTLQAAEQPLSRTISGHISRSLAEELQQIPAGGRARSETRANQT